MNPFGRIKHLLFLLTFHVGYADELFDQYQIHASRPSDINEHLPILRELASQCKSVTEIGIRDIVSTWGLLQGLSESALSPRSYVGIDLNYPPFHKLSLAKDLAKNHSVSFEFIKGDDFTLDIDTTDMLFIDSLHTYCHLTYELEKFSSKVRKYIVLHDTSEPWGERDEDSPYYPYPSHIDRIFKRGSWEAVVDFLDTHPDWQLKARYLNNHGLTVLKRKET